MIRSMKVFVAPMLVAVLIASSAMAGEKSSDGAVTGRITGVFLRVPYIFERDMRYQNSANPDVPRIRGLTIASDDGEFRKRINPGNSGFFFKNVPPGEYSLIRHRRERYDPNDSKTISILDFSVGTGQLVNLGTIEIVQDEPDELYGYDMGYSMKAKYMYRYRYERIGTDEGFDAPLKRYRERKMKHYPSLFQNISTVRGKPTAEEDSSLIELTIGQRERRD